MRTIYHTNLDEAKVYVWRLNDDPVFIEQPIPHKGERIRFYPTGERGFHFELEVCSVTRCVISREDSVYPEFRCEVELHIPSYYGAMTIKEWTEWLKRHTR